MNGVEYLLDTNVVIAFLSGTEWARSFFEKAKSDGAAFSVSSVTRMELLGFSDITSEEETILAHILEAMRIAPISREVEDEAIKLRRSHKVKLPDAIVAATAIVTNATLVTADRSMVRLRSVRVLNPMGADLLKGP
jgi:predicted nucleic acid-binding protein